MTVSNRARVCLHRHILETCVGYTIYRCDFRNMHKVSWSFSVLMCCQSCFCIKLWGRKVHRTSTAPSRVLSHSLTDTSVSKDLVV
jgi:hypothetical protein